MRAKLDESMPIEAAELLRAAGWECDTVYDEQLSGHPDTEIAGACQSEARVLFTLDLDFSDIRTFPPADYLGLVVLRPVDPSRRAVLQLLQRTLPVLREQWAENRLWIVEPSRIRTRE